MTTTSQQLYTLHGLLEKELQVTSHRDRVSSQPPAFVATLTLRALPSPYHAVQEPNMETTSAEMVNPTHFGLVYNNLAYQVSGIPSSNRLGFDTPFEAPPFLELSHYE